MYSINNSMFKLAKLRGKIMFLCALYQNWIHYIFVKFLSLLLRIFFVNAFLVFFLFFILFCLPTSPIQKKNKSHIQKHIFVWPRRKHKRISIFLSLDLKKKLYCARASLCSLCQKTNYISTNQKIHTHTLWIFDAIMVFCRPAAKSE